MTADKAKEQIEWLSLGPFPRIEDIKKFLEEHPNAEAAEARIKEINELEWRLSSRQMQKANADRSDDVDWSKAIERGTSTAMKDYLNYWPKGRHKQEARAWLKRHMLLRGLPISCVSIIAIVLIYIYYIHLVEMYPRDMLFIVMMIGYIVLFIFYIIILEKNSA
jgi:hypothetical protein